MIVDHVLSKDGVPVIRIEDAGKTRHLGSIYSNNKESDRWLQKYTGVKDFAVIVLFGLADGGLLVKLMNRLPSNIVVLVYEPSVDIYEYVKDNFDLSMIDDRVHLFIKGINESMFSDVLWESIDDSNYKISVLDAMPSYSPIFNEEYKVVKNIYETRLEHCRSDILSVAAYGRVEVENSINNLKYLNGCYCMDQLIGTIPDDKPVIIVSAGPSLKKNGGYLKDLKGHMFIIVVDTAVPYVLSIGVIPDLIVTVSPVKDASLYDERLSDIPIAIDPIVTFRGLDRVKNGKYIFISATSYYEKLFGLAGHSVTELESGGNVSSTAFSLAIKLGFKEIVLVGLDLALEDDVMYAGIANDEKAMKMQHISVDGYYGGKVYTLPNYKIFLDWFNMAAEKYPDICIYNATEGGADINGCINVPLKEFVKKKGTEECDYQKIIYSLPPAINAEAEGAVYKYISKAPDRIADLSEQLREGIKLVDMSRGLIEQGKSYDSQEVGELYMHISSVIDSCSQVDESVFVERIASEKNGNILEDINIGDQDRNLEYVRILEKLKIYFSDMEEACHEVGELFVNVLGYINSSGICDKNIAACDVYTAERLRVISEHGVEPVLLPETVLAKDGTTITQITVDGNRRFLNSSYSPMKEAERSAEKYININRYGILLMCGFSNGIIARKIISVVPDYVRVVFYEPSVEVFLHTIKYFDISDILMDQRTYVFIKGINDTDFDLIIGGMINIANYRYTYYDALPGYKSLFGKDYESIYTRYESLIQAEKNNIETDKICGKDEAVNNIYNLRLLNNCNCEEEFRGAFPTNRPVVIVASGPSLKKNVHELRRLKNKLLIIAVENAVRYLIDNGVRPDIAVIVDPIISPDVVEGLGAENIIYAFGTGSNHRFMECTGEGRKIAVTTRTTYYEKIFELVDHHLYALNSAGSVANIAFSLAQVWGFDKFVLVGQDLAYDGDKKYADDKIGDHYNLRMYDVPGYNGGMVRTSADFKVYLEWYEMMISIHPEFEVVDATEGGARIQGALQRPLSEVADEYQNIYIDYEKIIQDRPPLFAGEAADLYKKYIEQSVKNLDAMKAMLDKGKGLININLAELTERQLKPDFKDNNQLISQIMSDCADYPESYFVDGLISEKNADTLSDIYEENKDPFEEYRRMLLKTKEYADDMMSACEAVKGMFLDVLEGVEK